MSKQFDHKKTIGKMFYMNVHILPITCRGRVCLPENIHVNTYGRANPAPTGGWGKCGIHLFYNIIVTNQKK